MSMMNEDSRRLWTRKEVADYLRLTERSIDRLRKLGQLRDVGVGVGRSVRFERDDVMKLIDARRS
jgi:excisionase family DNA binding protein